MVKPLTLDDQTKARKHQEILTIILVGIIIVV
jgi:hypothetical protein